MSFVVIDVETANPDLSSICQVGVASFQDGKLHESWGSLVNPDDFFHAINISIHGISEASVRSAPKWAAIHEALRPWLTQRLVVSHTTFDRAALLRACQKHGLAPHQCRWLDSAKIARRAWPSFSRSGYGLANVANQLGIMFRHHDAQEDARAAGEIVLRAAADTGLSVEQWIERVLQPINLPAPLEANPNGSLYGEVLVFTGTLSLPRREAAAAASAAGCEVTDSVTKRTTLLVVGDQDIRRLAGDEKSSKHRKAEELIAKGQNIRILCESDFEHLLRSAS
ncbi:exonuclease domain-containing protein [Sorangium sp. So ce131]|uniref:exonuclease domain-containing protein n=1 Tax=Sorangium sp. So ce131 TaxID=3133282 RepID=UPI003F5F1ACE